LALVIEEQETFVALAYPGDLIGVVHEFLPA
jgi:hypothetical protein